MAAESSEESQPLHGSIYENDQEVIEEAVRMLRELDDTPLHQMTPLFYQHGYEELRLLTLELLRILGSDPKA
ncbi:hypothetical protein [Arthrobacter sp. Cr_A7]|jgi:hypothetical protein|uniref:hypothetical protein n=1 Tax=Arthrobacter sp. Cr_A7 TaxID=3031017 RepID=UPI0023DAC5F7|nr:hypothetical protein [Arthrobacter sp. Cr_A7]MDF2051668.1 hypothetical protein [Arthrobacter sp. Cr_A7]